MQPKTIPVLSCKSPSSHQANQGGVWAVLPTPLGRLGIHCQDGVVQRLVFLAPDSVLDFGRDPLLLEVRQQLADYWRNPHHPFSLPLAPPHTAMQAKLREALAAIPVATVITYRDLALILDTSPRAVGQACRANPLPLLIPCHRVVHRNRLGGYLGQHHGPALEHKHFLLQHEGVDRARH